MLPRWSYQYFARPMTSVREIVPPSLLFAAASLGAAMPAIKIDPTTHSAIRRNPGR
jgi:hypothetical protein